MTSTVPMDISGSSSSPPEDPPTVAAPTKVRGSDYAVIIGDAFPTNHVRGTLPPLIPVPPPDPNPADSLQWDTGVDHGNYDIGILGLKGVLERRHSGWEAVEKQWIRGELAREQEVSAQKQQGQQTVKTHGERSENAREAMRMFPYPYISIPAPRLESDFRIKISLSAQTAAVAGGGSDRENRNRNRFKRYTTYTGGTWSGNFGYGTVVSGGQETQDLIHGETSGMMIEATQRLKTEDRPPAYIECKARGSVTGTAAIMEALKNKDTASQVEPRQYNCRMVITMKTTDERYIERLNFGMWVGSCYWRGDEIVCE